jgi:hypothetical protein
MNKDTSQDQILIPFAYSYWLLPDDSPIRIARELWWTNQEISSADIPPLFSMLTYHLEEEQQFRGIISLHRHDQSINRYPNSYYKALNLHHCTRTILLHRVPCFSETDTSWKLHFMELPELAVNILLRASHVTFEQQTSWSTQRISKHACVTA